MHMKFEVGGRAETRQQVLNETLRSHSPAPSSQYHLPFCSQQCVIKPPECFCVCLSVVTINSDYSLRNHLTDLRAEILYIWQKCGKRGEFWNVVSTKSLAKEWMRWNMELFKTRLYTETKIYELLKTCLYNKRKREIVKLFKTRLYNRNDGS
jgi:hypothetical protein